MILKKNVFQASSLNIQSASIYRGNMKLFERIRPFVSLDFTIGWYYADLYRMHRHISIWNVTVHNGIYSSSDLFKFRCWLTAFHIVYRHDSCGDLSGRGSTRDKSGQQSAVRCRISDGHSVTVATTARPVFVLYDNIDHVVTKLKISVVVVGC